MSDKYVLDEDECCTPNGRPRNDECYGPFWYIYRADDEFQNTPQVLVRDEDGSGKSLALAIVEWLNQRAAEGTP